MEALYKLTWGDGSTFADANGTTEFPIGRARLIAQHTGCTISPAPAKAAK